MNTQPNIRPPVGSLAEYMHQITEITREAQNDSSQVLFYRGHADSTWKLEPTVYRIHPDGKSYRDVEFQMYQEILRRSPQAFQDCNTTFERLVKMQHYGLPTRLLDLTQSPLVALYFACCEKNGNDENEKLDGETLTFKIKKEDVYFQENMPFNTFYGFDFNNNFINLLKDIIHDLFMNHNFFNQSWNGDSDFTSRIDELYKDFEALTNLLNKPANIDELYENTLHFLKKCRTDLLALIHEDKGKNLQAQKLHAKFKLSILEIFKKLILKYKLPIFIRDQDLIDFLESYSKEKIIYPPLNNERIQRQRGAFICFPRYHYREKKSGFPTEHITISADKKQAILDELKTMGITRAYLFPELDVQADDIKNNLYPPT